MAYKHVPVECLENQRLYMLTLSFFVYLIGSGVDVGKIQSKKISNDQDLIKSDPTPCPQNQKGNN